MIQKHIMMKHKMRLGVIGCGAVVERFHLPAILARRDVVLAAAVDLQFQRANYIAHQTGAKAFKSATDALNDIDAAIVALPHNLHAPASIELLEAGKHVLVEKPMATTTTECDSMIEASKRGKATITVGQMRRFCPAVEAAKALLDIELIGKVRRFEILEGNIYNWPVASDFFFRKEMAGGGVLMDIGAHTFDMVIWYFGEVEEMFYKDDAFGGIEADCEVFLKTVNGIEGHVELSRTRNLPSDLVIEGDRGQLIVSYKKNQLTLEINGKSLDTFTISNTDVNGCYLSVWHCMIERQLNNWIWSLNGGPPALVPGEEGRKVINFIERCYDIRRSLILPWLKFK